MTDSNSKDASDISGQSGIFPIQTGMPVEGIKTNSPLETFAHNLSEVAKVDVRLMSDDGYATLEDLVQQIHDNPIDIGNVKFFQGRGVMPLCTVKSDQKKIVYFGIRPTEAESDKFQNPNQLTDYIENELLPRYDEALKGYKKRFFVLEKEQFETLVGLVGDKDKQRGFLRIVDKDTQALAMYNAVIANAIRERASDIHIEPVREAGKNNPGEALIRYRIDGVLRNKYCTIDEKRKALVQIIKVNAKMDISEKRRPQDGRIDIGKLPGDSKDINYSLRVSTLNTSHGEKAVLRVLRSSPKLLTLEQLGHPGSTYKGIQDLIQSPHGIFLVTGPTGSGKTTTLYAALQERNTEGVNICTVEDPVEMDIERINQTQVNEDIGYTFATGLQTLLRQDPDIILIGEIRDNETAHTALSAAKTGHLVFSTLHTNDAASTLLRIQDFQGINRRDLASCLLGVLSQRLVRKLCNKCKEPYNATPLMNKWFENSTNENDIIEKEIIMYKSKGEIGKRKCNSCGGTGYFGRTVVPELWVIGNEERKLIIQGCEDTEKYVQVALNKRMRDMAYHGMRKALQGETSLEEVLRVIMPQHKFQERQDYLASIIKKYGKSK
ncbi:type II/IV secretion system protein [Candidatus Pacearchaeota archaeon]|nr:type II/IV secretion system protein [Candidatus Pacearchaeota archaeon]